MKPKDYDDRLLQKLIRSLDPDKAPQGRLGVLGNKTTRATDGPTNAEIGAKHEYGLEGMPMRSWLRIPLIEQFQKYIDAAGGTPKKLIEEIMKTGSLKPLLLKLMIIGERVVADGFNSGGFGKWPPSDMRYKKNHQTLVETQQLRNSVTSEVK